ncbi:MAG: murein L,D-transpeptidase [Actinobacteria bacterium]|nr:murein L,D-transpeptidase [Actinomycetota bacterium]
MRRRRIVAAGAAVLATAVVAGLAIGPGQAAEGGGEDGPDALSGVTQSAPAEPTTQPVVTSTTLPTLPQGGLGSGDSGAEVEALERRLSERHYDPGEVDGEYDQATAFAVMALEKVAGMAPTGRADPLVWAALAGTPDPAPLLPDGGARRVEIDKTRQLLLLYEDGDLTLISHVSTGSGDRYCDEGRCGSAVTPAGAHRFMWRVNGWRQSRLGRLFNPVYFTGYGIAIHGFPSVPAYPASHGCVRLPMHTAEWFPSRVEEGDPVYVFDGKTDVQPLDPDPVTPTDGTTTPAAPGGWLDGEPPLTPPTTLPPGLLA